MSDTNSTQLKYWVSVKGEFRDDLYGSYDIVEASGVAESEKTSYYKTRILECIWTG